MFACMTSEIENGAQTFCDCQIMKWVSLESVSKSTVHG